MCLGENNAHHSVNYINAQLGALWENSTECVAHHADKLKPLERVRYDFALAEFYFAGKQRGSRGAYKEDIMFAASFDRPRLEFICNHEAVLHLKIKDGHYNLDYNKTDLPSFSVNRHRMVSCDGLEVALRFNFAVNSIRGYSSNIGNGAHIIQLMVFDFSTAQLVSKVPNESGRDAIKFYFSRYLEFLQRAGHHVLYSLPDFDDDGQQIITDYSLMANPIDLDIEVFDICDVSVQRINEYLSSAWLKAAMIAEGLDGIHGHIDPNAVCLAEYRSTWAHFNDYSDVQFHIKFAAPRVRALCKREVILYLKIEEICYYDGEDFTALPKHRDSDWELAFIVDIVEQRSTEGVIKDIRLDMSSIRFCEHLSVINIDTTFDFALSFKSTVIEFIEIQYTTILEKSHCHIIYVVEVHMPVTGLDDGSSEPGAGGFHEWGPVGNTEQEIEHSRRTISITWEERIIKTRTFGFDFIQAISHESIIAHFKSLLISARSTNAQEYIRCLSTWRHESSFEASFGPLSVRFLSNGKAIVWVQLESGHLKPLQNRLPSSDGKDCNFVDWRLAFEVDVKMDEHSHLKNASDSWFARFRDSIVWRTHGQHDDRVLKHLYLDFSSATFVYELSSFERLFHSGARGAISLVQAAVYFVQAHYLPHLAKHGHNILLTAPVWKRGSTPLAYSCTDITYSIYAKQVTTRANCGHITKFNEPVIVILGMYDFRPLPFTHLEYSTEWVLRQIKGFSYGTVCFSSDVFLQQRLLKSLARVNAETTIIPSFPEHGDWELQLSTWAHRRPQMGTSWKLSRESENGLDYKWDHRDAWTYEHEGSYGHSTNGTYSVSCQTKNHLHIPTTFKNGSLEISMGGKVTLDLAFHGEAKQWSTQAIADWSVLLTLNSDGSGIRIDVAGNPTPAFKANHLHIEAMDSRFSGLDGLLKSHLPHSIDITHLTSELKECFGGVWEHCFLGMQAYSLCNPVFNCHGDLLFELRPFAPVQPVSKGGMMRPSKTRTPAMSRTASGTYATAAASVPAAPRPSVKTRKSQYKKSKGTANGNGSLEITFDNVSPLTVSSGNGSIVATPMITQSSSFESVKIVESTTDGYENGSITNGSLPSLMTSSIGKGESVVAVEKESDPTST